MSFYTDLDKMFDHEDFEIDSLEDIMRNAISDN